MCATSPRGRSRAASQPPPCSRARPLFSAAIRSSSCRHVFVDQTLFPCCGQVYLSSARDRWVRQALRRACEHASASSAYSVEPAVVGWNPCLSPKQRDIQHRRQPKEGLGNAAGVGSAHATGPQGAAPYPLLTKDHDFSHQDVPRYSSEKRCGTRAWCFAQRAHHAHHGASY